LKKDIASLKWDIKELEVKETKADDIIKKAVGQIGEVTLKAQEANQRAATQPQISHSKIIFQYLFL